MEAQVISICGPISLCASDSDGAGLSIVENRGGAQSGLPLASGVKDTWL